jgi:hypothetical protein
MKLFKSKFASVAVAVIALVGMLASRASGATNVELASDRVGSGGRTVELATAVTKLEEKVPGVDNFHRILYMFEHGSKIDMEKASGAWTGIALGLKTWGDGKNLSETENAGLSINMMPLGPALDPLLKAQFCRPFDCQFLTSATDNEATFDGVSLLPLKDRPIEFRFWKGVVVGVTRPEKQSDGSLGCGKYFWSAPENSLQPAEPKACYAFYLYNFKPIPTVR